MLYQLALEASNDANNDTRSAGLNKRILSSLKPDKTMVFVMDLMNSGILPMHLMLPLHIC